MKEKIGTLFLFLFATCLLYGQEPLNLNFETKSVELGRPWGWTLMTWGQASFRMDSTISKSGVYSLKMSCGTDNDSCATQSIRFDFETFELANKTVTIEGFIRTQELDGLVSFSLGYAYLDSENSFTVRDTASNEYSGTSPWTKSSLQLTIPENAHYAYFEIFYTGNGTAWFDNFKLKINKKELKELKTGNENSDEEMAWLNANTCSLHSTTLLDNQQNNDLELFKKTVGDADLIGLGEATHGTSEFFTLKHRLLEYAVTEMGFRVFALEDNQLSVEKINVYVSTGQGTAKESMSGLFDVWYREEMLIMVEWVRSYNLEHPHDMVAFVGFDMQEVARPVDSLLAFLSVQDPELYASYQAELLDIKSQSNTIYWASDSIKLNWETHFHELWEKVNNHKTEWLSASKNRADSARVILGIQYAMLVKQFSKNANSNYWLLYRDEAMSENLNWIKNERYPGAKIVIWAHDAHISRCDHPNEKFDLNLGISMGSFLSEKYGENYKSFSLTTYQGCYSALVSYSNYEKIDCPLFPAPIGSLDYSLHVLAEKNKTESLFLVLSRNEIWLSAPTPKRFANHVSSDYAFWEKISMPYQFDGVFFIDETHASKSLE